MIEVIASYKQYPKGFIMGYIMARKGNELIIDDTDMYTDIPQFIMIVLKMFMKDRYKWTNIKVNCEYGVLHMQGIELEE